MHHAYCLVGDFESALETIPEDERKEGLDVSISVYGQLGITEARVLKETSIQRPIERNERIFIVAATSATIEAQNALLKLFEEPALTTKFYLIVPTLDILIPTLRSRLMVREVETKTDGANTVAKEFINATYAERLATIADRFKSKDDVWATEVIRGIEIFVEKNQTKGGEELLFVEKYMRAPGASKKMLLEHLALSLPLAK